MILVSDLFPAVRCRARKKIADFLRIPLPVLPTRMMCAVQRNPSDPRNRVEPRVHLQAGDLVVLPVDEQRLDCNLVGLSPSLVPFDRTDNNELGWALDGQVDGRIALEILVTCLYFLREGFKSRDKFRAKILDAFWKSLLSWSFARSQSSNVLRTSAGNFSRPLRPSTYREISAGPREMTSFFSPFG